jgi:hypothetical protein
MTLVVEHTLPLSPAVEDLFPAATLRRGSTVVVSSTPGIQGATTLAFSLAAAATAHGVWCAAVGFADLGVVSIAELGVALTRLALVPSVAPDRWLATVGALLDAVDVLVVRPPRHLRAGDARRLVTRTRQRGAVLIPVLGDHATWVEGADIRLTVTKGRWEGAGAGDGHLNHRCLDVMVGGRGAAAHEPRLVMVG